MASLVPQPAAAHTFRAGQRLGILPVLLVVLVDAMLITLYVWLVSVGTWVHWPGRWQVYDALATSFSHGQLSLSERPNPSLLALADPYDPAARAGIPFPQDLSLFHGRFYAYFGPVPALILLPLKAILAAPIGDQYLVLAFVCGILLVESWLLAAIRSRFFARLSPWLLPPVILTIGLVNPWPWILNTPSVHNAAITGGVFFCLAGLAAAFAAFGKPAPSAGQLAAAGLLWAAAVGTRITLLVPVGLLSALVALRLLTEYRRNGGMLRTLLPLVALVVPLAAGGVALAWYNWARFGSPIDTGFRYALGGSPIYDHANELFSPLYALQNLYNYSLTPFTLKYPFPYFGPVRGEVHSIVPFIPLPAIYHTQEMGGLLYTAPFALVALAPVARVLRQQPQSSGPAPQSSSLSWLVAGLVLWWGSSTALFLSYFWAAERFVAEFLPPLFLVSAIGYFQLDSTLAKWPRGRNALRIVTSLVVLGSIVVSLLVSISFNADGFRQLNPVLWRQLSNLFRP